jgi:predicted adenine nucleotide alpha hydrolase (AANH) superfamily ATPase
MRNYQKELDAIIAHHREKGEVPRLLLHACCAPCSSYCLEYLSQYFSITLFYYNPNIYPASEYTHRVEEAKRLVRELPAKHPITFLEGMFDPQAFYDAVQGLENEPEGGARCEKCYLLRLKEAGKQAKAGGFDYFTTTLSISPLKSADKLNRAGEEAAAACGVPFLPSDFKKKNGFKRSIELSKEYGLYRQNYCGCVFSQGTGSAQCAE